MIHKLNTLSSEDQIDKVFSSFEFGEGFCLTILHNEGSEGSKRLMREFDDEVNIIEYERIGVGGAGGSGLEHMFYQDLPIELVVSVFVVTTSFLTELGKQLGKHAANKIVKLFANQDKASKISVHKDSKELNVVIPNNCTDEQVQEVISYIDKTIAQPGSFCRLTVFEKKSGNFTEFDE